MLRAAPYSEALFWTVNGNTATMTNLGEPVGVPANGVGTMWVNAVYGDDQGRYGVQIGTAGPVGIWNGTSFTSLANNNSNLQWAWRQPAPGDPHGQASHTIRQELHGILLFVGSIWAVFLLTLFFPWLDNLGIVPRTLPGLVGIGLAPFLHANWHHLFANTIPLVVLLALLAGSQRGRGKSSSP